MREKAVGLALAGAVLAVAAEAASFERTYDTFGNRVATPACAVGLQRVAVPVSGYVKVEY